MIIFDTETTDLLKPINAPLEFQPKMTEIYLALTNKKETKIIDSFYSLINPEIPIPFFITRLTGIDNETVKDAPTFKKIHKKIQKFLKKSDRIVAHNLIFDMRMLEIESARIKKKISFPKEKYCTVEHSIFLNGHRLKNSELYEIATGKEIENIHSAKADVLATFENYRFLKKMENINVS